MMEQISQEEKRGIVASIPADERAFLEEQLEYFFPNWIEIKQKEHIFKDLVKEEVDFILGTLQISSISQDDIDKAEKNTVYCKA